MLNISIKLIGYTLSTSVASVASSLGRIAHAIGTSIMLVSTISILAFPVSSALIILSKSSIDIVRFAANNCQNLPLTSSTNGAWIGSASYSTLSFSGDVPKVNTLRSFTSKRVSPSHRAKLAPGLPGNLTITTFIFVIGIS